MVTFCYSKINNQNILETIDFFSVGTYVPLTMEGNIMIDGVLASCYPSSDHDLAHFGMTPIQLFPKITEWIFGENNGFQGYSDIAEQLGKWMLPCGKF